MSRSRPIQNITTVTQVGYRYAETTAVPATNGANVYANRGLCVPENASKKKEPVVATGSKIHKAPYLYERNLYHEFIRW